ncbi:MAG: hypothetical protein ORO03_06345 [Alphaproteobacteria bacterium]|nr:hypothetical protein [Alphaproteobacteria bacterium]
MREFVTQAVREDLAMRGSERAIPVKGKNFHALVQTAPMYSLSELLKQCDFDAPPPADMADWDNAPPVGGELW